jgi:RIO kinase 2
VRLVLIRRQVRSLLKDKLLRHIGGRHEGYQVTYLGYDYLALRTFLKRELVSSVGNQLGGGKEADIYLLSNDAGEQIIAKFHRLGHGVGLACYSVFALAHWTVPTAFV